MLDDCETDRQIAVALQIPSRSTRHKFIVSVGNTGKFLVIQFTWLRVITDISKLLKFRLEPTKQKRIEQCHPTVNGIRKCFRTFCSRETDIKKVTVRIALSVTVKKKVLDPKAIEVE